MLTGLLLQRLQSGRNRYVPSCRQLYRTKYQLLDVEGDDWMTFLVVGHMKFRPDWCFGLFRCLYKRTKANCVADIGAIVENSTVCNVSQFMTQRTQVVPTRDWSAFLFPHFQKIHSKKQSITSGSLLCLQRKCSPDNTLTHLKHSCIFFKMSGTLLLMTFHPTQKGVWKIWNARSPEHTRKLQREGANLHHKNSG